MVTQQSSLVYKLAAEGDTVAQGLQIAYIRWVGGASTGDECVLSDGLGNEVFKSVADGAQFIDVHPLFQRVQGLTATTLDSGEVYLYIR